MIRRPPRSPPFPYTTLFRSVETRRPLLIEDIRTDPRIPIRDRLLARGIRTLLLIPLFLGEEAIGLLDRKSTRLNSSHANISYAVFCLKKKIVVRARHTALRH